MPHLSFLQAPVAPGRPLQLSPLQGKVKGGLYVSSTFSTEVVLLLVLLPSFNPLLLYGSLLSFLSDPSVCKKCGQRGRRLITKWTKNEGTERERRKSTCTYGESHLDFELIIMHYCLSSIMFDTTINKKHQVIL